MMSEEQPFSPRFIFTDSWNFKLGLDGVRLQVVINTAPEGKYWSYN